jgi:nucleotidyltransferase/DNA polymerase involved in DNA repair
VIACLSVPSFELRVVLRGRADLAGTPAALAPAPGEPDAVGACTVAAERAGVRPGMRVGEALATCPGLVLVEPDPAAVAGEWEGLLRRLEDAGLGVESLGPGFVLFETAGLERLAGGLAAVLERSLAAAGREWEPRLGVAARRFAAIAAASVAAAGKAVVVDDDETTLFLEPLPLHLLPLSPERRRELAALGIKRLGELASLPRSSVADRLGAEGEQAWLLARAEDRARVVPRRPPPELAEGVGFPDPVATATTLEHALGILLGRLLARAERDGREPRAVVVSARLATGGSWQRRVTLREPTADPDRLRAALVPRLAEVTAPVIGLRLELGELTERRGVQQELLRTYGARVRERLREGLRQARASAGRHAVCTVVEVAPWSRIPESRAMLVPRDD